MTGTIGRRGFVELLGGASILGLAGSARAQVLDNDDFPGMNGLLVGPESERPAPDGAYIDQWDSYRFVYIASDSGARYFIETDATSWTKLDLELVGYDNDSLPPAAHEGQIAFNDQRKAIQWADGDQWEWPTFVGNDDVTTSATTVSNTTTETEIYRGDLDAGSLNVMGRLFILRLFGNYSTAASTDDFTYRLYVGEPGFDPTAGAGTLIADITTVQENVTDGPWQVKTTMDVFATGASGTLAVHTEGAFNNTKADDHVDPVTIDTTTGEEFAATVQWNNAKADNTVTRGIGYLQQSA